MSTTRSTLGDCPHCGTAIPSHRCIIEFETGDGTGRFAECPDCEDVVTPG